MDPMGLGLTIFSVKVSGMQVISKMFMKNWGCLFSPVHGAGFWFVQKRKKTAWKNMYQFFWASVAGFKGKVDGN